MTVYCSHTQQENTPSYQLQQENIAHGKWQFVATTRNKKILQVVNDT